MGKKKAPQSGSRSEINISTELWVEVVTYFNTSSIARLNGVLLKGVLPTSTPEFSAEMWDHVIRTGLSRVKALDLQDAKKKEKLAAVTPSASGNSSDDG